MTAPRRQLATRQSGWAVALARGLARLGMRPNTVSILGIVFAAASGLAFASVPNLEGAARAGVLFAAAAGIQLRLLCNLLDGMLAVEEGLKSKTGDIFNEVPDRLADIFILLGAGYSARDLPYGVTLGWAAAMAAVLTAYLRVFAGSIGATQHFIGPMAKQHRMFTLTVATLAAVAETFAGVPARAIRIGLALIIAGAIVTAIRRIGRLFTEVNAR
jgi:phosphatidylglycerophosphate synthase